MFGAYDSNDRAKPGRCEDTEAQKSYGSTSIQEVSVVATRHMSKIDMKKKKRSRLHIFYSFAPMAIICMSKKQTLMIIIALSTLGFVAFTNIESVYYNWSNEDLAKKKVDTTRSRFLQHIPYTKHSSYYTSTYSKDVLKFVQENYPDMDSDEEKRKKKFAILRPFCAFDSGYFPTTFDVWDEFPPCDLHSDEIDEMVSVDLFLSFSGTYSDNEEGAVRSVDKIIQHFYNGENLWSKCFQNVYAVETNIGADKDTFIPPMQEYLADWINGPNRQFERGFRLIQSGKWGEYETFYLMEGDSIPVRANWLPALIDDLEEKRPFAILGSNFEISTPKWGDFNKDYKSTDQIEPFKKYKAHGNVVYNTSHPLLDALVGHLEVEAHSPYNSVPFFIRLIQLLREGKYGEVAEVPPAILLDNEGKNITLSNNTAMLRRWVHTFSPETTDEPLEPFKQTSVLAEYNTQNTSPEILGNEYIYHPLKMYNSWKTHRQNISLVISNTNSTRTQEILSDLDRLQHPFTDIIVRGNERDLENFKMSDQGIKHAQPIQFQVRYLDHYIPSTGKGIRDMNMDPHLMDICDVKIENSANWFMIMDSSHNIRENADVLMANATSFIRNKKKRSFWQSIFGTKANHNHWYEMQECQIQNYWKSIVPFTPAYRECFMNYDCNLRLELGMRFHKDWAKVFYEWDVPFHVESRNEFCKEWRYMYIDSWEADFYQRQQNLKVKRLENFLSTQGIEATKALDFLDHVDQLQQNTWLI